MMPCPISHIVFPLCCLKDSTNPENIDNHPLKFTANNLNLLILKNPQIYCNNYDLLSP